MKLLIVAMLAFAPLSSFAKTFYGDSNNDLTTITVLENSLADCEKSLGKARELLIARKKALISDGRCVEVENRKAPNVYGIISFHKYL